MGQFFYKECMLNIDIYLKNLETLGDAFKRDKHIQKWHKDWNGILIKENEPELLI